MHLVSRSKHQRCLPVVVSIAVALYKLIATAILHFSLTLSTRLMACISTSNGSVYLCKLHQMRQQGASIEGLPTLSPSSRRSSPSPAPVHSSACGLRADARLPSTFDSRTSLPGSLSSQARIDDHLISKIRGRQMSFPHRFHFHTSPNLLRVSPSATFPSQLAALQC
jgi:hypothetical protein